MPKPVITGLYYGGVDNFIAPDGRPMVTGIRKRPAATGFLGTNGFPDDASAEPAHHTQDKTVHLFSNENYRLLEARLGSRRSHQLILRTLDHLPHVFRYFLMQHP